MRNALSTHFQKNFKCRINIKFYSNATFLHRYMIPQNEFKRHTVCSNRENLNGSVQYSTPLRLFGTSIKFSLD